MWLKGLDDRRQQWLLAGACCLSALLFGLVVNQIWEDFFISFRFCQNLAEGRGLVYEPDVRVHGFTSPLGTLLPALCYLLTGARGYMSAIWLYRLVCIPFYAGAGVLLLRLVPVERGRVRLAVATLYLLEVKSLAFSMNGIETALMLFFMAAAFTAAVKGVDRHWLAAGLAWTGLMWSRPDSCVYITALGVVCLAFPNATRKAVVTGILKAAMVTTVLYLPWFVWAWVYYGSPVPHTVLAKANSQFDRAVTLAEVLPRLLQRYSWVYEPIYAHSQNWPPLIFWWGRLLAAFSALYWLAPWGRREVRMASLLFLLADLYLCYMPYAYPWYYPPAAMLGLFVCAAGAFEAGERYPLHSGRKIAAVAILFTVGLWLAVMAGSWYQLSLQQRVVELGNRKRIGEWLHEHAAPTDRVYLECLGYIGYFSGCHMCDYPGLCSPEVAALSRQGLRFRDIVPVLQPEWLVLRPQETDWIRGTAYARENYRLKAIFNVHPELDRCGYIPGEAVLRFDALFGVYQHVKCPVQVPDLIMEDAPGNGASTAAEPGTDQTPAEPSSHARP